MKLEKYCWVLLFIRFICIDVGVPNFLMCLSFPVFNSFLIHWKFTANFLMLINVIMHCGAKHFY